MTPPEEEVLEIPHVVMQRIIRGAIQNALARGGATWKAKISKRAFRLVHHQAEKFITDMFAMGHQIEQQVTAGKIKTMRAGMLKTALRCRQQHVRWH
jgi:histone H3/H4